MPGVTESTLGARVFANAVAGKRADFIGNPDLPHTYSYVPDIAAGLATLGTDERAVGQVWHLPGPETVTTRAVLDLVAAEVGHPVGVRNVPKLAMRALGVVNPLMRELAEMAYEFEEPFVLDTTKFQSTFETTGTPLARRHRRHHRLVPDPNEPNMTASEAPARSSSWPRRRVVAAGPPRRRVHPAGLRGLLAGPRRPQPRRRDRDRPGWRGRRDRRRGLGVRHPGHRRNRPQTHRP